MFRLLEATRVGNGSSCQPCDPGWGASQGSCYLVIPGNFSWSQALLGCAWAQAHLVVISGPAEQTFLTSTVNTTTWIGLSREAQEGTHRNWAPGEPGDDRATRSCVAMLPWGSWQGSSCRTDDAASICEPRQSC
ncbi:C-type lectin domain family 4 member G [Cavia porcellus]|uniref:C-type lectin domain family 4 member G n=1 Tax=Cavia porcellus TaxID=10141 RepID=UPI000661D474